jgi:hypothetical protein
LKRKEIINYDRQEYLRRQELGNYLHRQQKLNPFRKELDHTGRKALDQTGRLESYHLGRQEFGYLGRQEFDHLGDRN